VAPFGLIAGLVAVAAACHGALWSTSSREKFRLAKVESRGLSERLGAPEVLIYGTGKEIVAGDRGAYPKKFGSGEAPLTEPSSGRLGFNLGHIRFD
jgi:hypothetical protein